MKNKMMAVVSTALVCFVVTFQTDGNAQTMQQNAHSATAGAQGNVDASKTETQKVAQEYVEGIDKGHYAQSWTQGDQIFQHTITQREWENSLNDNRKKLGKVKSRTLKVQKPAWDPHGLPKGAYMVVEYKTSFENAPDSGELLTMRRGSDGKWRVLTYQLK